MKSVEEFISKVFTVYKEAYLDILNDIHKRNDCVEYVKQLNERGRFSEQACNRILLALDKDVLLSKIHCTDVCEKMLALSANNRIEAVKLAQDCQKYLVAIYRYQYYSNKDAITALVEFGTVCSVKSEDMERTIHRIETIGDYISEFEERC